MRNAKRIVAVLLATTCMVQSVSTSVFAASKQSNDTLEQLIKQKELKINLKDELTTDLDLSESEKDDDDNDNDGLINYWENKIGTDQSKADTDGDGLTDYEEVCMTGTDPCVKDTDGNGVMDGDEDRDSDGLTNLEEVKLGTNPSNQDTDGDGLYDSDEVNIYHTNPLVADTDGDGATDKFEIENNFDPNKAEENVTKTVTSEDNMCSYTFTAPVSVAESVKINKVESIYKEDTLGAYSDTYEVTISGAVQKGKLSFKQNVKSIDNPVIYKYEKENETELLTACKTGIVQNKPQTYITSGGRFVLKSKTEVAEHIDENKDEIENNDVVIEQDKDSIDMTQNNAPDFNHDGISDELTKLMCDGVILTGDGNKVFGELTYKQVQSKDDLDGDGYLNGEEITLKQDSDGYIYAVLKSSPILLDTDNDGINDKDDTAPFDRGLKDGIVGSVRMIGRHTQDAIFMEGHSYLVFTSYVNNQTVKIEDVYNSFELNKEYKDAIKKNKELLSWRSSVSEITDENAEYREEIASDMWKIRGKGADSVTLNHGDYVSIGNYNMTSYEQGIFDAIVGSEAGTMMDIMVIKAIYEAMNGKEIDIVYVMTHLAQIIAQIGYDGYIKNEDVLNGVTDGGVWFNREMYNQKYQYLQYPNEMYEVEITQQQLDDMMKFYNENNYYSITNHNCSTDSAGAWNSAVGYERDENGNYIVGEDGKFVKSDLYISSRGKDIYAIFDLPAAICDWIREKLPETTKYGRYLGNGNEIVTGKDLKDTVNNNVNKFDFKEDEQTPDKEDGNEGQTETPDVEGGDKDNIETPDKEEGDKDNTETPDVEGGDKDNVETPDVEDGDKDNVETPDVEDGDKDNVETPDVEEGDKDNTETPDKEEGDKNNTETPDAEEGDKDNVETPDKEEGDKDNVETPDKEEGDKNNTGTPDAEEGDKDNVETPGKEEGDKDNTETTNKEEQEKPVVEEDNNEQSAQTGDNQSIKTYVIMAIVSMVILGFIIVNKRKHLK